MNNIIDKLAESLTPFAAKLGDNRYLTVLRDAFDAGISTDYVWVNCRSIQ